MVTLSDYCDWHGGWRAFVCPRGPGAFQAYLQCLRSSTERPKASAPAQETFLLTPSAALWHLPERNPESDPYDYPLVAAFGLDGQEQVISAVRQGRITFVCMTPLGGYYLAPRLLESFRAQETDPRGDLGACTLYERRP